MYGVASIVPRSSSLNSAQCAIESAITTVKGNGYIRTHSNSLNTYSYHILIVPLHLMSLSLLLDCFASPSSHLLNVRSYSLASAVDFSPTDEGDTNNNRTNLTKATDKEIDSTTTTSAFKRGANFSGSEIIHATQSFAHSNKKAQTDGLNQIDGLWEYHNKNGRASPIPSDR